MQVIASHGDVYLFQIPKYRIYLAQLIFIQLVKISTFVEPRGYCREQFQLLHIFTSGLSKTMFNIILRDNTAAAQAITDLGKAWYSVTRDFCIFWLWLVYPSNRR